MSLLFLAAGLALVLIGLGFIFKPPHRPLWGFACFVFAGMALMISFWTASTVGDDDDNAPTVTVVPRSD